MNIPALTEDVVLDQVSKIRQADVARKVDIVQFFSLQLEATPELTSTTIDAINGIVPTLIASHSHLLYQSTLTSLIPIYLPLLLPHGADKLRITTSSLLPPLFEKLSDGKDRISKPAEEALIRFAQLVLADPSSSASSNLSSSIRGKEKESPIQIYERLLAGVLEGKNPRGKVGAMRVLVGVRAGSRTLGLKALLPLLVALLEDGEGSVRDEAKSTLVALLTPQDIPPSVHAELRKMMQSRGMKPTLVDSIMGSLIAPEGAQEESSTGPQTADVPRVVITTDRELEHEFTTLVQPFTGKETEHNWQGREAAVIRVRGMILAGVYKKFGATFINVLRHEFWSESIKGLISLRTTLAMATCAMYTDTARALGESFDVLTDTLLPHLLKLSGSTKKIVAEASQQVTAALISHAACPPRIFMPFLEAGLAERTVQSRGYFMAHLAQYVRVQCARPHGKQAIEGTQILTSNHGTALAQLGDLIRRGLTDPNAGVKESARAAFVVFYREWPKQGTTLLSGLEDGVRRQVERTMANAAPVEPTGEVESTEAPAAVAPPAARRAPAGRKPSSAIAAAIRKAKEEARAARLAEATRVEQEATEAPLPGSETTHETGSSPRSAPPSVTSTAQPAPPETPPRHLSLPDMQTPQAQGAAFKVMTPAPLCNGGLDLLETTEISLVEPPLVDVVAVPEEALVGTPRTVVVKPVSDAPVVVPVSPKAETSQVNNAETQSSRSASMKPDTSIEHIPAPSANETIESVDTTNTNTIPEKLPPSPSTTVPRRPRISVNPTPRPTKPQPLYAKLRTLVDCSFWLDRRSEFPLDCAETLPTLLENRHSPLTVSDVEGLVGWSNNRSAGRRLDMLNDDEAIHTYVSDALQANVADEVGDDETASLIHLVEETLVSHEDEAVLKTCLFLLWNLFISAPYLWTDRAPVMIRCCLALRRFDSMSIRYGTAGLLALFVSTTLEKIHVLHTLLTTTDEVLARTPDAKQSRLEVFALINVAALVCTLPPRITTDQIPGIKPLLLRALGARAIPSREAAYTTLVAIQSSLGTDDGGDVLLRELLPELTDAQRSLAMYIITRDFGDVQADGSKGEGMVREMARLSRRL